MFNARHTTPDGWKTDQLRVTSTKKGRPRVTIHIGLIKIQMSKHQAYTLANRIVDVLEQR